MLIYFQSEQKFYEFVRKNGNNFDGWGYLENSGQQKTACREFLDKW